MNAFEVIKQLLISATDDVTKADAGNKAAATRVRKVMQEVKVKAQEVRVALLVSAPKQS